MSVATMNSLFLNHLLFYYRCESGTWRYHSAWCEIVVCICWSYCT